MKMCHIMHALCVSVFGYSAATNAITVIETDHGQYRDDGFHDPSSVSNIVGSFSNTEYRNWFVFDLSGITDTITSATLRSYNPPGSTQGYQSSDPTETWSLYDVSTDVTALTDGTAGVSAFNDLGAGTSYGAYVASIADNGTYIEIALNSNALNDLNTNASRFFAIGGAITTLDGTGTQLLFANGTSAKSELLLSTIPVPAAVWLFGFGLLGLIGMARQNKAA